MELSDYQLVQQILQGDTVAERTLYRKYERVWFRVGLRYGKNRYEAEDILQEGLLRIIQYLKQFDPQKGTFKNWSTRILVNAALRYLEKYRWQETFADLEQINEIPAWHQPILEQITAKELIQLVQQLPTGYRVVFNLYAIEGYTHREIADLLQISISTSKSQLHKARKLLQRQLVVLFRTN